MTLSQLVYAYLLWQVPLTIAALLVRMIATGGTRLWQLRLARSMWALAVFVFPVCYFTGHFTTPRSGGVESIPEPRGTAQIVETQLPDYLSGVIDPAPIAPQGLNFDGLEFLGFLILIASGIRATRIIRSELGLRRIYRGSRRLRDFPALEIRISSEVAAPLAAIVGLKRVVFLDEETAVRPELTGTALLHEIQHHRQGDPYFARVLAWASALYAVNPVTWGLPASFELLEEQACDEGLVSTAKVGKQAYCRVLLAVAENSLRASPQRVFASTRGLTRQKSALKTRIESLMNSKKNYPRRTVLLGAGIGTTAILASSWKLGRWGAQAAPLSVELGRYLNTSEPYGFFMPDSVALREMIDKRLKSERARRYLQRSFDNYPMHGPYIEEQLAARGMPAGLLVLAMLESTLDPEAANRPRPPELDLAWAKGLWQFIPTTARSYGLVVNTELDERSDVVKSTAAALNFLSDLHEKFGDWPLAIAAYNVGPEKVQSAIEEGGSRDLAKLITEGRLNRYGLAVLAMMVIVNHQELLSAEL